MRKTLAAGPLETLPKNTFLLGWFAVAYLHPGLHPDDFEEEGSGWEGTPRQFVTEAWRRAGEGELEDGEIYPCNAAWCGLYDDIELPKDEEREERERRAKNNVIPDDGEA